MTIIVSTLSCGKSNQAKPLFGESLLKKEISRELPVVPTEKVFNTEALNSSYQAHLDNVLDSELVKVESLILYQNKESFLPLQQLIKNSSKYLYMNVLAFDCDAVTGPIIKLMEEKARSGVDVRLILNKALALISISCQKRLEKSGVKIIKAKAHSTYFLNDQQELIIGSQSVVRMYFLSDGFNSLNRDMSIYTKGPLATDALKDFLSIWSEEGGEKKAAVELSHYQNLLKNEYQKKIRGKSLYTQKKISPELVCRFAAERPRLGVNDIQVLWKDLISISQKEIVFSGVKVEIGDSSLGAILKEKSNKGVSVKYLGNSYLSGNGELTMVLVEWMESLKKSSFSFLVPLLSKINDWDKRRVAYNNQELYDVVKSNSKIDIRGYFNFIHYKAWLFDAPGVFIGSANLDMDKFNKVYDTGIYCLDAKIHSQLKAEFLRDQKNSELYQ